MFERVSGIMERINEIQGGAKRMSSMFKPQAVTEFEQAFRSAVSGAEKTGSVKMGNRIDRGASLQNESPVNEVESSTGKSEKELIQEAVQEASEKFNVSPDLINSVIRVESSYNPEAVSHAGAMGLMQLMPKTALELGVEKPFDIKENIEGGTKYLRKMMDRYKGDLDKSLAAYNAGPHNVDLYDGVPDFKETQNYVRKIKDILF